MVTSIDKTCLLGIVVLYDDLFQVSYQIDSGLWRDNISQGSSNINVRILPARPTMLILGNVFSLLLMQVKIKMFGNSLNDNGGHHSLTSGYLNFNARADALFCAHLRLTSAAVEK